MAQTTDGDGSSPERPTTDEIAAWRASHEATVASAKWLMGSAGAIASLLLAGVGLTRLGEATGLRALGAGALAMLAITAVARVLWVAQGVLQLPFADLADVIRLRQLHRGKDGNWTSEHARVQYTRADQVVAAETGNRYESMTALHAALQEQRAIADVGDVESAEIAELALVARVAVTAANQRAINARHRLLLGTFAGAIIVVMASSLGFIWATSPDPQSVAVDEPIAVRVFPASGDWPSSLEGCRRAELAGVAVSGSWPSPTVVTAAAEGCPAAQLRSGIHAVPVLGAPNNG